MRALVRFIPLVAIALAACPASDQPVDPSGSDASTSDDSSGAGVNPDVGPTADAGATLDVGPTADAAPGIPDAMESTDVEADAADATPDAMADATPDAMADAAPDAMPDAGPDAMPDAAPDAMPDAGPDAMPDAAPDAMPDAAPDAAPDAMPDVLGDVSEPLDDAVDGGADALEEVADGPDETCPTVGEAAPPAQAGVAYVAHFWSQELRPYRLDGDVPTAESTLDLGAFTHDLALDPDHDLLAVAQDTAKQVRLYSLTRPTGPAEPLTAPEWLVDLDTAPDAPRFVRFDRLGQRLLVVAGMPAGTTTQHLYVYDTSSPTEPALLPGAPFEIPATTSLDVDPVTGILFLVDLAEDHLRLYDLNGDAPTPLAGTPPDLISLYPQENSTSFQARDLRVDGVGGRVLAARAQTALSEVIAFDYPPGVANDDGSCPVAPTHDDLTQVADFFDADVPLAERPNLLDAFVALPHPSGGAVLVAGAWNGSTAATLIVPMTAELGVGAGCGDYEGFGCWLFSYFGGNPGSHRKTDGAACLDATHGVVVATSMADVEDEPGEVHLFRLEDDLSMTPWLSASGSTLSAGALPVAAVCH